MNFIYAVYAGGEGGTFGDTFGAANALFSGTALLMLVLAVILQRDELEIVREERDATRDILASQETINQQQKQALDRQLFESTFLAQFRLLIEEIDKLSDPKRYTRNPIVSGKDAAIGLVRHLSEKKIFSEDSTASWARNIKSLELMHRMVLSLYVLARDSEIDAPTRHRFLCLLRALVTPEIATAICVRGLRYESFSEEHRDYRNLIEGMGLLELWDDRFRGDFEAASELLNRS